MANWNEATIQEFHAKAGKGVGSFGDQLILLTTRGARSGKERITPVMFHRDGERYVVIASKGGAPDHPAWYRNLKANPLARVEVGAGTGTETFEVGRARRKARNGTACMPSAWRSHQGSAHTSARRRGRFRSCSLSGQASARRGETLVWPASSSPARRVDSASWPPGTW